MKIIDASNKRAIARLLARDGRGDRAFDRSVRTIVDRVRSDGDRALLPVRAKVRRRAGPARGDEGGDARAGKARGPRCPACAPAGREQHRPRRVPADSAALGSGSRTRRLDRAAGRAARARRLLRAGGTLPTALFAADDGRAGAGSGRDGDHRRVPAARAGRDGGGSRGRREPIVPRRRRARHRGARVRDRDGSTGR